MEILILLFTDLLLIVKVKKADQFQLMKPPIPFEAAVFLDRSDSEGKTNRIGKRVYSSYILIVYSIINVN